MQKIIPISLLFFLIGCANQLDMNDASKRNQNWCWFENNDTGEGEWVPITDQRTIKNGKITYFYYNGLVAAIGKIEEGQNIDTTYFYNLDKELVVLKILNVDSPYYHFVHDGHFKINYRDGTLKEEGIVIENKASDNWKFYSEQGNLKKKKYTLDSLSIVIHYYDSGKIEDSLTYFENNKNGEFKFWHKNGELAAVQNFKDDERHGIHEYFYENGKLSERNYFENGIRQDSIFKYFENGKLNYSGEYKNGKKVGIWNYFDKNGNLTKTKN